MKTTNVRMMCLLQEITINHSSYVNCCCTPVDISSFLDAYHNVSPPFVREVKKRFPVVNSLNKLQTVS